MIQMVFGDSVTSKILPIPDNITAFPLITINTKRTLAFDHTI